jgi:hypothetical protein
MCQFGLARWGVLGLQARPGLRYDRAAEDVARVELHQPPTAGDVVNYTSALRQPLKSFCAFARAGKATSSRSD